MKHIQKKQLYIKQYNLTNELFHEDCIFFDIETTGFSPASSSIYLIGCLRKVGDNLVIDQFFAESKTDEKEVLEKFMTLLHQYKTIISFNGIGFDVPFIKAKCDTYDIEEHLKDFEYIDIFKLISSIKFLLKLPNYKQKTLENFLDIHRDDKFSGGELINVYDDYVKTHSVEAEELLLLHNFEDVTGMLDLIPALSYLNILKGGFRIKETETTPFTAYDGKEGHELIITLENDYIVPKRVSYQFKEYYFTINKNTTKIRIPLFEGELKYFYENYKDYFYLPAEDMAVHKSVATFVDKQYRERAKASNCYTRKTGVFLPQLTTIMNPTFKLDYKDKVSYFELTSDFSSSDVMLRRYVNHIFEHAMKTK
ncbi:MAG: ribonuclease H-like domain-containing protein [Agathobacter sp.]|nr:ribonuclease H-like domain-containing protein [Agathobacter sp.]